MLQVASLQLTDMKNVMKLERKTYATAPFLQTVCYCNNRFRYQRAPEELLKLLDMKRSGDKVRGSSLPSL